MNDRYRPVCVDPTLHNNAHSYELQMLGWGKRVLELGPAAGYFTAGMVAQNCVVTVIEGNESYRTALEQIAEKTIIGDLNQAGILDQVDGLFDAVVCGDVLEHLLDPQRVLCELTRFLAPGGKVIVSVPNIAHVDIRLKLLEGRFEYTPAGLLDETHIRFFTRASVHELVRRAGLVILDMRTTRIPAFHSEQAPTPGILPDALLQQILQDPDAETYQFVFMAVKEDGQHQINQLALNYTSLQQRFDQLQDSHETLRALYVEALRRHGETVDANLPLPAGAAYRLPHAEALELQLTETRARLTQTTQALGALQASRTLRYTAMPRALYRAVCGALNRVKPQ